MSLILVQGRPRSRVTFLLTALGLALLMFALVLAVLEKPGVVPLSVAGGGLLVLVEAVVWSRRRRCRWIEDLGDSFCVIDSAGERVVQDDEVTAISYYHFARHSEGLVTSVERHFTVWAAIQERPIDMVNVVEVGEPDPLDLLIDRILSRLEERAEQQLVSGSHIEGDGWRLDRWGIAESGMAESKSAQHVMPQELAMQEITGVDLVGHELCIWRQGQEQVALRIPIASRNAHLLYLLISRRVVPREAAPPQAPQEGLGRLLFELGYRRRARICVVLAIAAAAGAGLLLWSGGQVAEWAAGGLFVVALSLVAGANFYRKAVLRCHEFGVFQTGLFRNRELRYDQITTLSYAQERQFYRSEYTLFKGVYTGTSVSLRLEAAPDSGLRSIDYGTTLQRPNENIDRLRDRVAEQIADLMESFVNKGQPIHWTTKITLHGDGIEYVPKQFVGRRKPVLLPYARIAYYAVAEMQFVLWANLGDAPIVEEPTSQKNFYPGLVLFERLMARRNAVIVARDEGEASD